MFLELDFGKQIVEEVLAQDLGFIKIAPFHGIEGGGFLFGYFQIEEAVNLGNGVTADSIEGSQFADTAERVTVGGVFEDGEGHFLGQGFF